MKSFSITAATLFALAAFAYPQEGLYAPRTPGDAVLVRVANLSDGVHDDIDIGPVRYPAPAARSVGAYRSVPLGIYMVGSPSGSVFFSPEPGSFATIVIAPDRSISIVPDEAHTDPARAQIVFYNFSGAVIDAESLDPPAVFARGVEDGESAMVVVNAITLLAAARSNGEVLVSRRIVAERGSSYGLFVLSDGGFVVEASVAAE